MRRAIWMALAFMGTAPLVALAQQNAGAQAPAGSPTGTPSIQGGQDTAGAGNPGTAQGQTATGDSGGPGTGNQTGVNGVPLQQNTGPGSQGLTGTGGAGMGGTAGPTYRGTTPEMPSASPPVDVGTQVGPEPGGEQAGSAGTGTGGTGGGGGAGGGQAAAQQTPAPVGPEAMQRELVNLRQRVAQLEREVDELRGTGGGGTGGTGTGAAANVDVQGPVAVATAVFDGRVVDVSARHIDIVDTSDGTFYRLAIDEQTQAFTGPQLNRIPVERISEGTPVRTSFALISGVEHARNIVTQPQRQQPRQQGQQQQSPPARGQQRAPTR